MREILKNGLEAAIASTFTDFLTLKRDSEGELGEKVETVLQAWSDSRLDLSVSDVPSAIFDPVVIEEYGIVTPTIHINSDFMLAQDEIGKLNRDAGLVFVISMAADWFSGAYARRRSFSLADALALQLEYLQSQDIDLEETEAPLAAITAFSKRNEDPERWQTVVRSYFNILSPEWDVGRDVFCQVLRDLREGKKAELKAAAKASIEAVFHKEIDEDTFLQVLAQVDNLSRDPLYFQELRERGLPGARVAFETISGSISVNQAGQLYLETMLAAGLVPYAVAETMNSGFLFRPLRAD